MEVLALVFETVNNQNIIPTTNQIKCLYLKCSLCVGSSHLELLALRVSLKRANL